MPELNLCNLGQCTATDWVDGMGLESKVYPGEDAMQIARESFSKSVILQGVPQLEGAVDTTVNVSTPFVTWHEDVKQKKRFKRDTLRIGVQSKATGGKAMNGCGFFPKRVESNQLDATITVQEAYIHLEECPAQLLPTYQQAALRRQAANAGETGWESPWLSLEVEYGAMKTMAQTWDTHAFMGDYGVADINRTHTDGWIKDVVLQMGAIQLSKGEWTFTGDLTDTCIEYRIGGETGSVAFDTNMATTLAAFVTKIETTDAAKYLDAQFQSIFEDVSSTSTKIIIEMAEGYDVQQIVQLVITNCDGFTQCVDGSLVANTAVTDASFTFAETVKAVTGEQPISFDYEPITAANVVDKLDGMYAEIMLRKPELLSDPTFSLFISPNVYAAYEIATKRSNQAFVGSGGTMPALDNIWGGTRLVKLNGNMLPPNFIFGAKPTSLHAGTYLKRDMTSIESGYDRKCGQYWYKSQWNMGFKTVRLDEIVGTFTDPGSNTFLSNFKAVQPDPFA